MKTTHTILIFHESLLFLISHPLMSQKMSNSYSLETTTRYQKHKDKLVKMRASLRM
jgi:hypothetical protein